MVVDTLGLSAFFFYRKSSMSTKQNQRSGLLMSRPVSPSLCKTSVASTR